MSILGVSEKDTEILEKVSRSFNLFLEKQETDAKYIKDIFKDIKVKNGTFSRKVSNLILHLQKKVESHDKLLKEVITTIKVVDESLCNVLLAIRKNEYLQAHYPKQKGFPEMKVVGIHPAKIENKEEYVREETVT